MLKRYVSIGILLVASLVLAATASAQTSPSTIADAASICKFTTMNHFWKSGGSTNKEPSGFCVFSGNHEFVFIFVDGNIYECSAEQCVHYTRVSPNSGDTIGFIDGNLTVRTAAGALEFQTGTLGHPDAFLQVQDNGGLFIYNDNCNPLVAFTPAPVPAQANPSTTCVLP